MVDNIISMADLAVPEITVERLSDLSSYLTKKSKDTTFPKLTVLPNFVESVLSFVNERKIMKIEADEYKSKIKLASGIIDKKFCLEMEKLDNETRIQLATIKGDVEKRLREIDAQFDTAIQQMQEEYGFKREQLRLYYESLEKYRQDQNYRFQKMVKAVNSQRFEYVKYNKDLSLSTGYIQKKMIKGRVGHAEMESYMVMMKMRLQAITNMGDAVYQIASKVK